MDSSANDTVQLGPAPDVSVLRADQTVGRNLASSAYQTELGSEWVWAHLSQDIDTQRFLDPAHIHDVLQIYRVLEVHFAYSVSQLTVQNLAHLSETEDTAGGRAFYGGQIARAYQHLEVFGFLVDIIRTSVAETGVDLDDDSTLAAVHPAYKYQQLLEKNEQEDATYDLRLHAVVFNYVFSIGGIAAIRALHVRLGGMGLGVWDNIRGDLLGLLRRHWQFLNSISAEDATMLRDAFDVEQTVSLDLLTDEVREEVKGYMMDLFEILPLPARAPASSD